MMSENEKYVIRVCELIEDFVINGTPFPPFLITDFMAGLRELKERRDRLEDDGK